jgi:hypothetical protein
MSFIKLVNIDQSVKNAIKIFKLEASIKIDVPYVVLKVNLL